MLTEKNVARRKKNFCRLPAAGIDNSQTHVGPCSPPQGPLEERRNTPRVLVLSTSESEILFRVIKASSMTTIRLIATTQGRLPSCRLVETSVKLISPHKKQQYQHLRFCSKTSKDAVAKEQAQSSSTNSSASSSPGWWRSAEFWGGLGAVAGWGMSGAAIYDASLQGPEVISLTMTPVLMVYSTLFARWAWIVKPRNLLLMWCHIANVGAQSNQLRRALEYKKANGQEQQLNEMLEQVAKFGAVTALAVTTGPKVRSILTNANLGPISTIAAAPAGPFTVHFW
jgi:mitochondrial pyruvate carrier 1